MGLERREADCYFFWFGSIQYLRDLKAFFGTTFKIKPVVVAKVAGSNEMQMQVDGEAPLPAIEAPEEYVLSVVGTGFVNISKRT